jgi:hypothetical protein
MKQITIKIQLCARVTLCVTPVTAYYNHIIAIHCYSPGHTRDFLKNLPY